MAASHVLELPRGILVLRIFQILFAVIILGMSAYGIYWIAFGSWSIALFTSLATIIIASYSISTQYISAWNVAYNYWAVLALDIFGVIFWLSSMAALAATRSTFVVPTTIHECVNYGNGGVCDKKRDLIKRVYEATNGYLSMMSGSAGLAALEMILFGVSLTIFSIYLRRYRASRAPNTQSEYKLETNPMGGVVYSPLAQQQQLHPQYMQPIPQQQSFPTQNLYQQSPLPPQQYYQPPAQGY